MQMTYDQSPRPGIRMAFARRHGRDYMMRSEKRPGYGSGRSGKKPPRKKRRTGFFYIFLTSLLSVLLWPVGMVLLWRRRMRMQVGTKLLFSLVTLFISIFLIVFSLTVPTENPTVIAFQDKANDFLDKAADDIAVAGDIVYRKGVETYYLMSDFTDAYASYQSAALADSIDQGVEWAQRARSGIANLFSREEDEPENTPGQSATPEQSSTPGQSVTPDVPDPTLRPEISPVDDINALLPDVTPDPSSAQALSGGMLYASGSFAPGVTPKPSPSARTTGEPASPSPEASGTPTAAVSEAPTDAPDASSSLETSNAPTSAASETPADTPEPTQAATPEVTVTVKPAGEAVVYYNDSGVCYHMQSSCRSMSSAKESTLAEAVAAGKIRCRTCGSPLNEILEEENVIWVDESGRFHTTDECESFEGSWRLMTLEDAIEDGCEPCPDCQADLYAEQSGITAPTPTPEPTATPSPTPEPTATPDPTATPEPTVVRPDVTLKPAGEATVYHSSNGSYYHKVEICKGMSGSDPYTLAECVDGYKRCKTCDAPLPELVDQACLWMDEDKLCHTSDECAQFKGSYTLILRDDALTEGLSGCPDCGADEYLVPNTILDPSLAEIDKLSAE